MPIRFATVGVIIVLAATPAMSKSKDLPKPGPGELATIDPVFDQVALRVGYLSDVGQYDEAWTLCDSLRSAFPDHPAPYLYTASVYVNWMQSHRLSDYEGEVAANVERAIEVGTRLQKTSDDALLSANVGAAYGYRAMTRLRRHNWIGAYLDGRRSIGHVRDALEADPQLYDLYFPLGGYHYWRTARSSFFRAVAFWMPDRRDLVLQQMELAVHHGRYIRNGALHGIALSLYDAGDIDRALAFNGQVMALIDPPTNGSLYLRGRLMARVENWPAVEATFQQLLAKLPAHAVGYQVECKYWIARAHQAEGRLAQARVLVGEALAQSLQRNPEQEIESALESFDAIREQLVELGNELESDNQ